MGVAGMRITLLCAAALTVAACGRQSQAQGGAAFNNRAPNGGGQQPAFAGQTRAPLNSAGVAFDVVKIADFDSPWALAFLPDGRMLVTEKDGKLLAVSPAGAKTPIAG